MLASERNLVEEEPRRAPRTIRRGRTPKTYKKSLTMSIIARTKYRFTRSSRTHYCMPIGTRPTRYSSSNTGTPNCRSSKSSNLSSRNCCKTRNKANTLQPRHSRNSQRCTLRRTENFAGRTRGCRPRIGSSSGSSSISSRITRTIVMWCSCKTPAGSSWRRCPGFNRGSAICRSLRRSRCSRLWFH